MIRTGNGGGLRFGAQHSQSIENWAMAIPGVKVVAPSTPADVVGLFAAAIRDPDPVLFFEHKALYASKGEVPDGEIVDTLGTAKVLRRAATTRRSSRWRRWCRARSPRPSSLAERRHRSARSSTCASWCRSTPGRSSRRSHKTGRLFTVEENPRLCGWGAEIVSIVGDEAFAILDGPIVRITTPHMPLPAADALEDLAIPSPERIADTVRKSLTG